MLSSSRLRDPIPLLFQGGKKGVVIDPSDRKGVFSATGGLNTVAPGLTVGLALDRKNGRFLSGELMPNGDFSDGITGWISPTQYPATVSASPGGGLTVTGTVGVYGAGAGPAIPTVVGKYYLMTVEVTSSTLGYWLLLSDVQNADTTNRKTIVSNSNVGAGKYSIIFVATATTTYLHVNKGVRAGVTSVSVGNVSCREVSREYMGQSTAGYRPMLGARVNMVTKTATHAVSPWVATTYPVTVTANAAMAPNGTMTATSTKATVDNNMHGNFHALASDMAFAGKELVWTIYAKADGYDWMFLDSYNGTFKRTWFDLANGVVGTVAAGVVAAITAVGDGWFKCTATMTLGAGTNYMGYYIAPSNGVHTFVGDPAKGILTWRPDTRETRYTHFDYQEVDTSVSYADVGAPRYLEFSGGQIMNTLAINFTATDEMTLVMAVMKKTDTGTSLVLTEVGTNVSSVNGTMFLNGPNVSGSPHMAIAARGTVTTQVTEIGTPAGELVIVTGTADISAPKLAFIKNGVQTNQNLSSMGTGNFGNHAVYLGGRAGLSNLSQSRVYFLMWAGASYSQRVLTMLSRWLNHKLKYGR